MSLLGVHISKVFPWVLWAIKADYQTWGGRHGHPWLTAAWPPGTWGWPLKWAALHLILWIILNGMDINLLIECTYSLSWDWAPMGSARTLHSVRIAWCRRTSTFGVRSDLSRDSVSPFDSISHYLGRIPTNNYWIKGFGRVEFSFWLYKQYIFIVENLVNIGVCAKKGHTLTLTNQLVTVNTAWLSPGCVPPAALPFPVAHGPAAWASPGGLLEMEDLRLIPDIVSQDPPFNKICIQVGELLVYKAMTLPVTLPTRWPGVNYLWYVYIHTFFFSSLPNIRMILCGGWGNLPLFP